MSQKNQLNLASLHQRQEEMSESEMKVVVAGVICICDFIDVYSALSGAENPTDDTSCHCGSGWVLFGLAWG